MLLARTVRIAPRVVQHSRGIHVENTINNNFPFKYGQKKAFIVKSGAFMGFAFAVPFVACEYKMNKQ